MPEADEVEKLKQQMWPQKTSNIKNMFEAKGEEDAQPKEVPKPIDLEAEINGTRQYYLK